MRSFFYKEVIPPDMERRNYLLRKIAYVKKNTTHAVKGTQNLLKMLRNELKKTDGKILYFRKQKGFKIPIGNETTSKKYFLLSKDNNFLTEPIREFRDQNKKTEKIEYKSRPLRTLGMSLQYRTKGGVMQNPNFFGGELQKVRRKRVLAPKVPSSKDVDPYIGLELEYASTLSIEQVTDLIIDHKLYNDVRIMRDGSIRTNEIYQHQVEFCILTKWSDLSKTLQRLKPIIFDKPQYFSPNSSCGLHVHLDMRHDSPKRVFKNLVSMQSVLFSLVAEHRRDNRYCVPVTTMDFDEVYADDDDAHYDAISKYAYNKHETIEVRIHQSTLSLTKIERWVTLLKRIADYKGAGLAIGTFDSELKLLKEKIKIELELVKYIEEREAL